MLAGRTPAYRTRPNHADSEDLGLVLERSDAVATLCRAVKQWTRTDQVTDERSVESISYECLAQLFVGSLARQIRAEATQQDIVRRWKRLSDVAPKRPRFNRQTSIVR